MGKGCGWSCEEASGHGWVLEMVFIFWRCNMLMEQDM